MIFSTSFVQSISIKVSIKAPSLAQSTTLHTYNPLLQHNTLIKLSLFSLSWKYYIFSHYNHPVKLLLVVLALNLNKGFPVTVNAYNVVPTVCLVGWEIVIVSCKPSLKTPFNWVPWRFLHQKDSQDQMQTSLSHCELLSLRLRSRNSVFITFLSSDCN